jgi:hypothetical protein
MIGSPLAQLPRWLIPAGLGAALFCIWLKLAKSADWISCPGRTPKPARTNAAPDFALRRTKASKMAIAVLLIAAALPVYVFSRLASPRPLPATNTESGSNYQELINVGVALLEKNAGNRNAWLNASDARYSAMLVRDASELDRLQIIIDQGCEFPWPHSDQSAGESDALWTLSGLLRSRMAKGNGTPAAAIRIEACFDAMRFAQWEDRKIGPFGAGKFSRLDAQAIEHLWNLRDSVLAQQCRELADRLRKFDNERASWEQLLDSHRLAMENSNWTTHLRTITHDWAGAWNDRKGRFPRYDQLTALKSRMAIVEFGIRAFELETGRLPETLDELRPNYLPSLPDDPMGGGPLRFRQTGDAYLIYSVGPNGIDDGGQFATNAQGDWLADVTPAQLFFPPPPVPKAAPLPAARDGIGTARAGKDESGGTLN